MKIGEVAKKTGVSLRTIRYYEELRLIKPKRRTCGGFRLYGQESLSRIRAIQSLQELGLSLKQIRILTSLGGRDKTRGELARDLLSRLRSYSLEAEKKRSLYQAILQDFDEGIRILNDCQDCTIPCDAPHCGKHSIFLSDNCLPNIIRSLF